MPEITSEKLMKDYYERIKNKYPDLSYEECRLICRVPFKFLKWAMQLDWMPEVVYTYLGRFIVTPGKAKNRLAELQTLKEKNIISEESYNAHYPKLRDLVIRYVKEGRYIKRDKRKIIREKAYEKKRERLRQQQENEKNQEDNTE